MDGIGFPKTESAGEVEHLERQIADLERSREVNPGRIELALLIESPRGLLNLEAIAGASRRIRSMSVGPEDYCLEIGVEPSADGAELHYAVSKVVTVCKAAGIAPMGLLGSIAGFRDLGAFERAASRARDLGCVGASCIHPDQGGVLNRVFSPPSEKVGYARRVVKASRAACGPARRQRPWTGRWWARRSIVVRSASWSGPQPSPRWNSGKRSG